ncbi:hypothetical protein L798_13001 [Zootermopsis nevadensis]|uniref:Uncharacterized protein n=1 Tax=Zootermopsis nevadensis TaxID=136037 RepID=A0A067RVB4_ZOONE|nr:hypothetical protein L798_13001 [Zootermopsis nevadensis]
MLILICTDDLERSKDVNPYLLIEVSRILGNFGGICGLFVGFSLISIVEFVYFFTLRLFFVVRDTKEEDTRDKIESRNKITRRAHNNGNIYWREIMPRQVASRY